MNILIPDTWLRNFLQTSATPTQLQQMLSLCGPSVERISNNGREIVYDVEITTNRPDSMSVFGVAREAAAILPRFGIKADLLDDPYNMDAKHELKRLNRLKVRKPLHISTDHQLNPRWTCIVIENVSVKPSPEWLQKYLELTGIRALNNVVDVTNFLMRAFGQPAHVFDYDTIAKKNGVPTMILRASKKREKLVTLDDKSHALPGDDIVIEDGAGKLIDLCGIMGGENSSVKENTKNVILFIQTYDPAHIRKTSMSLAHRTEAAALFEKGLDPELVLPILLKGAQLLMELTGGNAAGPIIDLYPQPFVPYQVALKKEKLTDYLHKNLADTEIKEILTPLGLKPVFTSDTIQVRVPSFRRDIEIDVDVIEEIARIYGYHNLENRLPEGQLPLVTLDPQLKWEEEIKTRLRDWGFTETYTYPMVSGDLLEPELLPLDDKYAISNPLSKEWEYMRPSLIPSLLACVKQNLNNRNNLRLFELSHIYLYRENDLPHEQPSLLIVWTGEIYDDPDKRSNEESKLFSNAKGLAEALFYLFGIPWPPLEKLEATDLHYWNTAKSLKLGDYGALGIIYSSFGIKPPVALLELNFEKLAKNAKPEKRYTPIPKYPPVIEDLSFVLPDRTPVGEVMKTIQDTSRLVSRVLLLDQFENTSTFRIYYLDSQAPLSDVQVTKLRAHIVQEVQRKFAAQLKGDIIPKYA